MEPLMARLLRLHGVDPNLISKPYTITQGSMRGREGIFIDTLATDMNGDPLVDDVTDDDVVYQRFYPEPDPPIHGSEPPPDVRGECA